MLAQGFYQRKSGFIDSMIQRARTQRTSQENLADTMRYVFLGEKRDERWLEAEDYADEPDLLKYYR